ETPQDFMSQRQRPEFMTIAQLDNYIWKLSKSGATGVIRNLKVDLYQKFSSPLTTPIIILLAIPFAMRVKRRSAGLSSVVISLMLGFLYFVINAISVALGKAGILVPFIAASLSHILALYTTYYLLKKLP
ncbi:MAG: LptF/LptG family permease, partial [Candidatus Omnitrophica bacterium]|nr:LptF/LptG family permease [Candidatus Omnitrophota bacterium]